MSGPVPLSVSVSTIFPVTVGGLYERFDGTVAEYAWRAGHLILVSVYTGWDAVPQRCEACSLYHPADSCGAVRS